MSLANNEMEKNEPEFVASGDDVKASISSESTGVDSAVNMEKDEHKFEKIIFKRTYVAFCRR